MMWPCLLGHDFVPGVVTHFVLFWHWLLSLLLQSLSCELASGYLKLIVRVSPGLAPKPYTCAFSYVFESQQICAVGF